VSDQEKGRVRLSERDLVGLENGRDVEHIVVLMLENRSFDHMLGYLSLPADRGGGGRDEIDGLDLDRDVNTYNGTSYPASPLGGRVDFRDPDRFDRGPDHSAYGIDQQLANGGGGFVSNYAATRADGFPPADLGLPMGYYTGAQLYAYDFLARNFCVSDRWFCSTPGATMPNRLYAATGRCARSRNASMPPVYAIPSLVRHLDQAGCDWAWFAHIPFASLWALDIEWAANKAVDAWEHLHPFDEATKTRNRHLYEHLAGQAGKSLLDWIEQRIREFLHPHARLAELRRTVAAGARHGGETFASLAESDNLPRVSFIDPLFVDVGPRLDKTLTAATNDDHPPSNVALGQKLVRDTVTTLVDSPAWPNTLLLITYDEHGGFYDHVQPPSDPALIDDADVDPQFHRLGPRVPAFLVSPRVSKGSVAPTREADGSIPADRFYDHTSILKTILATFCLDPATETIPEMGPRVTQARHVLDLLTEAPRTKEELDGYDELERDRPSLEDDRQTLLATAALDQEPTELQREYQQAAITVLGLQHLVDPAVLEAAG
jgi:phospholipase C